MVSYSKSFSNVKDPYCFLALNIFEETKKNIYLYLTGTGSVEERADGKWSLDWITKMKGNFKILSIASYLSRGWTLEEFHQYWLQEINRLKRVAYEKNTLDK